MGAPDGLGDFETGKSAQFLGQEVVAELDRLIKAIEDAKMPPPSGQKPSKSSPSRRRLVSLVSELIVLKDVQVEVNRRTRELAEQKEAAGGDAWDRAIKRLVQKQSSISEMTAKIARDIEKIRSGEPEDEPGDAGKAGGKARPRGAEKAGAKDQPGGEEKPDGEEKPGAKDGPAGTGEKEGE